MITDFDKTAEKHIEGFKGDEGKLDVYAFVDDQTRIAYSTLRSGVNSGKHRHIDSFEVMYVTSGELTAHYDDTTEAVRVGQSYYRPEGYFHWSENCTDHDVVYPAIVPTLRQVWILFMRENIHCREEKYFFSQK